MDFRPRILVAEGDIELRRLLISTMHHMGADPVCVESNEGAQSLLRTEKFDGAVLDCDQRYFNPQELTLTIRKSSSNAGIPVALLSAHPESAEVQKGFKSGTTFFLAKPFGSRELECLLNATRGAMLEERRRYQRVPANIPVLCEWKAGRRSKHVMGRSINVSNSGLLIRLTPHPEPGVAVDLELTLPRPFGKALLRGVVVRTGPGDNAAVRFLPLTKGQQDQIEDFISHAPASSLFSGG